MIDNEVKSNTLKKLILTMKKLEAEDALHDAQHEGMEEAVEEEEEEAPEAAQDMPKTFGMDDPMDMMEDIKSFMKNKGTMPKKGMKSVTVVAMKKPAKKMKRRA